MVEKTQLERTEPAGNSVRNSASPAGLLTAKEVADQMRLSMETLAQWRSQKRGIPYVKISRNCVRYRQADLDCWLSERIVRTAQDDEVKGRH